MEEFKNISEFVIEKTGDCFTCEVVFKNGDVKTFETCNVSGNIYIGERIVGGFDDPVEFEIYTGNNLESISYQRSDKDESIYVDIYLTDDKNVERIKKIDW